MAEEEEAYVSPTMQRLQKARAAIAEAQRRKREAEELKLRFRVEKFAPVRAAWEELRAAGIRVRDDEGNPIALNPPANCFITQPMGSTEYTYYVSDDGQQFIHGMRRAGDQRTEAPNIETLIDWLLMDVATHEYHQEGNAT